MIVIPEQYVINVLYENIYKISYNKYTKTYNGCCPICKEGDSRGKKKRFYYIPNKELVQQAYQLKKQYNNVELIYIKAHTNNTDIHSLGNDGADRLANQAIGLETCPYNSKL